MADNTDYAAANARIAGWGKARVPELQAEMDNLGIKHRKPPKKSRKPQRPTRASRSSIRNTVRKKKGLISSVGYSIPKHMIYVHKGVGRGTTIEQVGSTNRKPKPWFNPVIEKHIDNLADIVAEELGSSIINRLSIR